MRKATVYKTKQRNYHLATACNCNLPPPEKVNKLLAFPPSLPLRVPSEPFLEGSGGAFAIAFLSMASWVSMHRDGDEDGDYSGETNSSNRHLGRFSKPLSTQQGTKSLYSFMNTVLRKKKIK